MYIGLFLLIPFLNIIYNNLKSQKHKQILVWTLFCLTILPSMFNIFNFETSHWWAVPSSSDIFSKIVPAWWINFYPITYYFVGCYLREYGLKIKTKTFDVKVCNAVTSISITSSLGENKRIPVGTTIDINYTISDAAAAAEFGDRLTWHLVPSSGWTPEGGIESYVTITQDGKLTTHKDTPTGKTSSISAQIIHPKYPGHPTDNTNITVTSNEISSLKILPASTAIEFNPTSISYNYGSEGDLW